MIREILKILVGAQAAHLFLHIVGLYIINYPIIFRFGQYHLILTESWNRIAIGYNFLILLILIYFAYFKKPRRAS